MATTSAPPGNVQILTVVRDQPIDWRTPFWTLTMAMVFAGTTSILRMIFTGTVKWAEPVGLAALFCWRYWAHATGLFAWRFHWPRRFRHFSFLQTLLNGFTYLILAGVLFSWPGNSLKKSTWLAAAVLGSAFALVPEEHTDPDPSHRV